MKIKAICPNCNSVIDVDPNEQFSVCKKCETKFVTKDAVNMLIKNYKSISRNAKQELFTYSNFKAAEGGYKELLKLKPNDLGAITGLADCIFLSSTLDEVKYKDVIALFDSFDIFLNTENTYLFLNYLLEVFKYIRIYFREVPRTQKDKVFISKKYYDIYVKAVKDIEDLLDYFKEILKLVDEEEYKDFTTNVSTDFEDQFKYVYKLIIDAKDINYSINHVGIVDFDGNHKNGEVVNFDEEALEDNRIFIPDTSFMKERKRTLIIAGVLFGISLLMLILGLSLKVNVLSWLAIIPLALMLAVLIIFIKRNK